MFYVVQENTFREANYDNLIDILKRLDLGYDIVKSVPFTDTIYCMDGETPYVNNRKDIFVFGSVKLARTSKLCGWEPGSLLNENHDYRVYSKYWGENLLNYDSKIIKLNDDIRWDSIKFIRPCEDTKTFTGQVFNKEEWDEFKERTFKGGHETSLTENTEIQVSIVKIIYKEIRCWTVGGKVISCSQYKLGNRFSTSDIVDDDAIEFAQKMVDIFQLADAFVIDICLTEDGWKIVEAGCINCAGFYEVNLAKVIIALEDLF